jgi:hypothetical protein
MTFAIIHTVQFKQYHTERPPGRKQCAEQYAESSNIDLLMIISPSRRIFVCCKFRHAMPTPTRHRQHEHIPSEAMLYVTTIKIDMKIPRKTHTRAEDPIVTVSDGDSDSAQAIEDLRMRFGGEIFELQDHIF